MYNENNKLCIQKGHNDKHINVQISIPQNGIHKMSNLWIFHKNTKNMIFFHKNTKFMKFLQNIGVFKFLEKFKYFLIVVNLTS